VWLLFVGLVGCARTHGNSAPLQAQAADAGGPLAAGSPAVVALDGGVFQIMDAMPRANHARGTECGDAGEQLPTFDPSASKETLCLRPDAFIDDRGRSHAPDAGSSGLPLEACPAPAQLVWPGGGESCWWTPLCASVEQRPLADSGTAFECCYLVVQQCGV